MIFVLNCLLQGCLPLVLMFDIKNEVEVDAARLAQLMEQLDVFISIKPKPRQPSKVRILPGGPSSKFLRSLDASEFRPTSD